MEQSIDWSVRQRAGNACEYCHMPQAVRVLRFQIDHIIARQHGGPTALENLALCCGRCNRHKGPNIAGIDPQTGVMQRLFNPRIDAWADHFEVAGPVIAGRTPIGRTTVAILCMNHPDDVAVRIELIESGLWPTEA